MRYLLLLLFGTGCALTRPHVVETTATTYAAGATNITVRKEIWLPAFVVWPANQTLEKQRGSIGKTVSAGFTDANQDGGGTNMVESLKALDSIIGKIRP